MPSTTNKKHRICCNCHITETPLWRSGPNQESLCNSCGVRYKRGKLNLDNLKMKSQPLTNLNKKDVAVDDVLVNEANVGASQENSPVSDGVNIIRIPKRVADDEQSGKRKRRKTTTDIKAELVKNQGPVQRRRSSRLVDDDVPSLVDVPSVESSPNSSDISELNIKQEITAPLMNIEDVVSDDSEYNFQPDKKVLARTSAQPHRPVTRTCKSSESLEPSVKLHSLPISTLLKTKLRAKFLRDALTKAAETDSQYEVLDRIVTLFSLKQTNRKEVGNEGEWKTVEFEVDVGKIDDLLWNRVVEEMKNF